MNFPQRLNSARRLAWMPALGLLGFALLILPACGASDSADEAGSNTGTQAPAASSGAGGAATDGAPGDVLAVVGEEEITRGEVQAEAQEQLDQAEMQKLQCEANYKRSKHQVYENTVQQLVRDQLVAEAAEAKGVSEEELIQTEVNAKVAAVTDLDIDTFYNQNRNRIPQPKEQVAARIREYLQQQRVDQARSEFYSSLESANSVEYKLGPFRVDVAAEGAPAKGPADAPVTIVEFSDFQCPYCSRVVPALDKLADEYGDKVRIVFRHFPLDFHENAQKAAEASLCAADQGKFWQMHDLMFEEQQQLAVENLKEKAERLGLDTGSFNECLDSDTYAAQVQADMQAGVVAGVQGTPAMFINGRFLSGAQPYEAIAAIVDEELERVQ
jgi:protein-disulfide isomerase